MADKKGATDAPVSQGRGAIAVDNSIKTASFSITPDNWLQQAVLVNVWAEQKEGKGDNEGKVYDTINFEFRGLGFVNEGDNPHVPRFVLSEFAILQDAKSGTPASKLIKIQDERIAQIYDTFMGVGKNKTANEGKGLGYVEGKTETGNASWGEFYESVANSFRTARKNEPVYKSGEGRLIPVWLKLTFDSSGGHQVPMGNFIDQMREGRETLLRKGSPAQYEAPTKTRKTNTGNASNTATDAAAGGKPLPKGF